MEELLEDLALTKDYALRFLEKEQKANRGELCRGKVSKKNLLSLLF